MKLLRLLPFISAIACSVIPQIVLDDDLSLASEDFRALVDEIVDPNRGVGGDFYVSGSQQYTGYLDIPGVRRMFFWLLESQEKDVKNPVLLWMNGGPGCSSLYGLLTQWGPKVFSTKSDGFIDNLANLNQKFNLLILDQPIGTGLSYSPTANDKVTTSPQAAEDVFQFLLAFKRKTFPDGRSFRTSALHISGESFAGHTIPWVGERISRASPDQKDTLQLKSLIIGNGWIDQATHLNQTYELICNRDTAPFPEYLLSQAQCDDWYKALYDRNGCSDMVALCQDRNQYCDYVRGRCNDCVAAKYMELKRRDVYDLSKKRDPPNGLNTPRNRAEAQLAPWVNKPAVPGNPITPSTKTSLLGATAAQFPNAWVMINDGVFDDFGNAGDWTKSSLPALNTAITGLPNLRVLLYAGDQDLVCTYTSIQTIAYRVNYEDAVKFRAKFSKPEKSRTPLKDEKGNQYGSLIAEGRLMFARIYGAGHMVNENRPKEAKEMFEKWVGGFDFNAVGFEGGQAVEEL